MVQMMVFVNLFLVPVVGLYMYYRKREKPIVKSLELLFQYCIAVSYNVPAAKVFIFSVKKLTRVEIPIDSGYYTLAALISTVLLAWLYLNVRIKIVGEGTEQKTAEDVKDEER